MPKSHKERKKSSFVGWNRIESGWWLVNIRATILVISRSTIQELGLVHLVVGLESYKTILQIVMQATGRLENLLVKVGGIKCFTTYMVVDMHSYKILMGLSFLVKIGVIMDVKRGLIQVINDIGLDIQVLPLNTINMINLVGNDVFEDKQFFMSMLCDEKGNETETNFEKGDEDLEGIGSQQFKWLSMMEDFNTWMPGKDPNRK